MSRKMGSSMSDWEFIRATQVERRECQSNYGVAWKIDLGLEEGRSVIYLRMTAYEIGSIGEDVQLAKYETSWPNAQVQTFPACLFQAAVRLTRLVEDSRRDEELMRAKRQ